MLTPSQKRLLENKIYGAMKQVLLREAEEREPNTEQAQKNKQAKRQSVQRWLDSAQQLHSTLAYRLMGVEHASEVEKATARSLFSKKYRGEDADGKPYSFSDDEINTLYNMKDDFIEKIK